MNQEDTVDKVFDEMINRGMIIPKYHFVYLRLLYLVFAAGFDCGRLLKSHRKPVLQLDKFGNTIKEFVSATHAAAQFKNTDKSSISRAVLGKQQKAGGYRWKFK